MQNRDISPLALIAALAALASACAASQQPVADSESIPEFHGAVIGDDTLRSRLDSE
jgi:hypothetical protein